MKTKILTMTMILFFLLTTSVLAIPLSINSGAIAVGSPDEYTGIFYSPPPGGDAYELSQINLAVGTSYTLDNFFKFDNLNSASLIPTDDGDYTAFDFGDILPDYFLFFQAAKGYIYKNIDSLNYAVTGFRDVSHISVVYSTPVPEPSAMLLIGLGLVGIAGLGRNKLIKK